MRSKYFIPKEADPNKVDKKQKKIRKILKEINFDLEMLRNPRTIQGVNEEDRNNRIDSNVKQEAVLLGLKCYLNNLDQVSISYRKFIKKCKEAREEVEKYSFEEGFKHKKRTEAIESIKNTLP